MNFATYRLFDLLQWLHLVAKSFLWYSFQICDNHTLLIILLLSVVDISFVCVVDV